VIKARVPAESFTF